MKRAFIITLLIAPALWLAGCEIVDTHYVGRHHGFYGPPPAVIHHGPVSSPPRYYNRGHTTRSHAPRHRPGAYGYRR